MSEQTTTSTDSRVVIPPTPSPRRGRVGVNKPTLATHNQVTESGSSCCTSTPQALDAGEKAQLLDEIRQLQEQNIKLEFRNQEQRQDAGRDVSRLEQILM